jgi:hypothetical protein
MLVFFNIYMIGFISKICECGTFLLHLFFSVLIAVVLSFWCYKFYISGTDLCGSTFVVIYDWFIYFYVSVVLIHGIGAYSIDHIVNCNYFIPYWVTQIIVYYCAVWGRLLTHAYCRLFSVPFIEISRKYILLFFSILMQTYKSEFMLCLCYSMHVFAYWCCIFVFDIILYQFVVHSWIYLFFIRITWTFYFVCYASFSL